MIDVKLFVWTLADCEWRAAAPGQKPWSLPRAPTHMEPLLCVTRVVYSFIFDMTRKYLRYAN